MALNDINQDQQFGYYSSEYFTIDYQTSAGAWLPIPGVQDISFSGSTAPPRDIISANSAAQQKLGISRVGQVTVNATYMPQDEAWRKLRDAQYDQTLIHFRVRWNAIEYFKSATTNGATCAIATTGVVTFNNGASNGQAKPTIAGTPLGRGQLIVMGTGNNKKGYVITGINASDVKSPKVANQIFAKEVDLDANTYAFPDPAVTAGSFTLYSPAPLERQFSALVSQGSDMEMGAESEMTTSLVLAPTVRLPDPKIYLP